MMCLFNKNEHPKRYAAFGVVLVIALSLTGCRESAQPLKDFTETQPYFGTHVAIRCLYDEDQTDIRMVMDKCWRKLDGIQASMNVFSEVGDVASLNKMGDSEEVQVNDDLYRLIRDSIEWSRQTEGAFDITVLPLIQLWRQAAARDAIPEEQELEEALRKIGSESIRLHPGNRVAFGKRGMKIDLGGIVAGFSVDAVASILSEYRIQDFIIDAGGEIYARGRQPGESGWRIGVQDPTKPPDQNVIGILELNDMAVSTSGNYERFYTIQGEHYSHVIDPRTGHPASRQVVSVTVVAQTAEAADALSTALCVLGGEEGIHLIDSTPDTEAFIVEHKQGRPMVFESSGYKKFCAFH